MNAWYQLSKEETLRCLDTGLDGLSSDQAQNRLNQYGTNTLTETGRKKAWQIFLAQFQDLLVIILVAAALVSMVSDQVESTIVIFAVILLNAILGTVQHQKAQKSLDSLKALSSPSAKVLRDGETIEIDSTEVVPGDILFLETGDLVVADGRILENYALQTDESSLTGESVHVEKKETQIFHASTVLADRSNMIFAGSLVTAGRVVAVVTETGMQTEIGKIAALMNQTESVGTPLQVSLDQFSGRLALAIMGICAFVFGLSLYRKMPLLDSLMFAVALAVAAIPEALGSIVTIVQAMGTQKMAKEHAIIKDLKAVESLGCVSVICSDKTGTLTQNRMSVSQLYLDHQWIHPEQLNLHNPVHQYLLYGAVLVNDAVMRAEKKIGDPTEFALLAMAAGAGIEEESCRSRMPRYGELSFDSVRKRMSTVHCIAGKRLMLTKGAPDVLLECSTQILLYGGVREMRSQDYRKIQEQNLRFSEEGLRVLAFVYREIAVGEVVTPKSECGYIWIGMTAMMDPPRSESRAAVLGARRAGIRTVMITGDHKVTATSIAEKIGVMEPDDRAVTGAELDEMSESELSHRLPEISVYARVSPEHKIRIVQAWQACGAIVAMTGDGVNDAPALKKADIGIAMGITGTEVSKDAASMILADDNFATILKAVANGRNVYRNIKNAIRFLLSGNIAGIFCVLYTSFLALPVPFAPVHLLFINLLTDSLPAIAIGMEPAEESLLEHPPRDPREGILTPPFLCSIVLQGVLIAICTMLAYHTGLSTGGAGTASTMAFTTLTLARLLHGFNCRSEQSIVTLGMGSNLWTVMAFEAGVILLAAVLFVPGLQILFAVADLSLRQLGAILIFAAVPTMIIQAVKTMRESFT